MLFTESLCCLTSVNVHCISCGLIWILPRGCDFHYMANPKQCAAQKLWLLCLLLFLIEAIQGTYGAQQYISNAALETIKV